MDGLQLSTLSQTGTWPVITSEGVQILNESNAHWVCVSTVGCPANIINLYNCLADSHFHSLPGPKLYNLWHELSEAVWFQGLWPLCYRNSHSVVPWWTAWFSNLGSDVDEESPTEMLWRWKVGAISRTPGGWDNQGRCCCETGSSSILYMQYIVHAECLMTGRRWLSALIAKSGFTRSANISMQMYLKEERSLCVPIVLSCRIVFNQFFSCFSDCCCTHWICVASLFLASLIQVRFVLYIYQFCCCHKKQYLVSMSSQQFSQAIVSLCVWSFSVLGVNVIIISVHVAVPWYLCISSCGFSRLQEWCTISKSNSYFVISNLCSAVSRLHKLANCTEWCTISKSIPILQFRAISNLRKFANFKIRSQFHNF